MTDNDKKRMEYFEKIQKANTEGYAGCLPNGNLVDRRKHPQAYPVAENAMFGITKPRCIKCEKASDVSSLENSLCSECKKNTYGNNI